MEWTRIPPNDSIVEMAAVVGEAELVLEFGEAARGWFRITVLEDLRSPAADARFFARAVERDDATIQAFASGPSPEEAATRCVREAGVSLRRARGR